MKSIFKDIFDVLRYNFRSIVLFELIYKMISIVFFMRISKILFGNLMKSSGYSYLTLKNLSDILLNPITYPIVLTLILISVLIAGYEMAVLHTGFRAAAAGCNMKIRSMLFVGLKRFFRLCMPTNIPVLCLNAASYLVLQIIPLRSVLMTSRRVNDAFEMMQEIRILKALFAFALITLIVCVVYNAFVGCFQAYGYKKKELFKVGHAFWLGKRVKAGTAYITGLLGYVIMYTLVYIVCIAVMMLLVVIFATDQYEIVLVDEIGRYIKLVLAYFACVAAMYMGVGITVAIFYHYNVEQRENIIIKNTYDYEPWLKRFFVTIGIVIGFSTVWLFADTIINGNLSGLSGTIVMSHRGDSYEAPENTIPAIELAIEKMADYVEIDVHETKDGEIVVVHDSNLKRTTGVDKAVNKATYAEISEMDAGSYFSREYAGVAVPTLREVLEICKSRVNVNIEIKSDAGDAASFIKKITDIVAEYDMEEQCIFQSSYYSYLKLIKSFDVDLQTGLIIAAGFGNYFEDDNVDFFSVNAAYINEGNVNMAHKYGKRIYSWTVNSYSELVRMKNVGIDGVITDKPLYAKEILEGTKETRSLLSYIKMHMKY